MAPTSTPRSTPRSVTPSMKQVHRQRSVDGLYTIDPEEVSGLQHISSEQHFHKHARPQTNEGLQAGIPTKHLAGLQISLDDGPQVIEDDSHLQPQYFERDGFKKWQSPDPIRILGLRRRLFYGVVALALFVLIAAAVGIAVGVTHEQQHEKELAEQQSTAALTASLAAAAVSSTTSGGSANPSSMSRSSINTGTSNPATEYQYVSTNTWTATLQTVAIFSGTVVPGQTPSYHTTATLTAPRAAGTHDADGTLFLDQCPQINGTYFNTTVGVLYQRLCYTTFEGLAAFYRTSFATFDECIESCGLVNAGAQPQFNAKKCNTVTWTADEGVISGNNTGGMNCVQYSAVGAQASGGDFTRMSAIYINSTLFNEG